jgi:ABC-type glycerol-3-phosphate transport system substrate-binding protein
MSGEKKEEKMDRRKYIKYIGAGAAIAAAAAIGGYYYATMPKVPPKKILKSWGMVQSAKNVVFALEGANAIFESKHPEVKIETKVFEYPVYRQSLLTAVEAGTPPDVSTIDQIWSPEFAAAGYVEALDDLIAASPEISKDKFFPGAWDSNLYEGKMYGIPFDVDVWEELYYNRDMFEEVGLDPDKPPETWDDLLEYGKALTDPKKGRWGLALIAAKGEFSTCVIDSFIFSNGGDIVDITSKPPKATGVFNSPQNVETFEFLKKVADEICPPGVTEVDEFGAVRLFTTGKTAMILVGGWEQDTFKAQAPKMNWDVGYIPVPKKGQKCVGCFGGWNLVIYKKSKEKDLAWEYIKLLTREDVNYNVASLTPALISAAKDFLSKYRKGADIYFDILMHAKARPLVPQYPRISDIQLDAYHAILLGQKPVKKALDDAAAEMDRVLRG